MSAINKANDGMSAALLAEALLESGDLAAAQTTAAEAIALCRRSLRAAYEAALAKAAPLIERTGAKLLAIGAPLQAERIERALAP